MKENPIHASRSQAEWEKLMRENAQWITHLEESLLFIQNQIWAFQEESLLPKQALTENQRLKKRDIAQHQVTIEKQRATITSQDQRIGQLTSQNQNLRLKIKQMEESYSWRLGSKVMKAISLFLPKFLYRA